MRALAFTVGVTVEDELPFKERLEHVHQGMVNYAVAERSRIDQTLFGSLNVKTSIAPRLKSFFFEFPLKLNQILFEIVFEVNCSWFVPFPAHCLFVRKPQIQWIDDLFVQVCITFTHF